MIGVEYIRHSTDDQPNSRQNQKNINKDFAERKGIKITHSYEDLGISGGAVSKRPGLMQLLLDAEKKLFEIVIFYKYDRAFRNLEEQIVILKKLRSLGVKYVSVTDPEGDGASGELILNILGAVNQFERELTGERIYDNNRQRAKAGYWTGGNGGSFGYDYNVKTKLLEINPKEAEIVKEIFTLYLEHESASKVAKILREKGYTTKNGNTWTVDRVLDVLRNEVYIGKVRWGHRKKVEGKHWHKRSKDYELFDGRHQSLIDIETFEKAKEIREGNAITQRKPSKGYFLSALVKCGYCGGRVSGHVSYKGDKLYRCEERYHKNNDCQGWSKIERFLEKPIFNAILHNIKQAGLDKEFANNQIEVAATKSDPGKKIKQIEEKLHRQLIAYENGVTTLDEFTERRKALMAEKEKLEQAKDAPVDQPNKEWLQSVLSFENLWWDLTPLEKNKFLRMIVEYILIDKENITIVFQDADFPGWQKTIHTKTLR